jgi:hypothetical protein
MSSGALIALCYCLMAMIGAMGAAAFIHGMKASP